MNRYDLVLLGLILEKERSGYDIITEVRNRELDRWQTSARRPFTTGLRHSKSMVISLAVANAMVTALNVWFSRLPKKVEKLCARKC